MKNKDRINLSDVYFSRNFFKLQRISPFNEDFELGFVSDLLPYQYPEREPISLWKIDVDPNYKGYGYEDDADIGGTATNLKDKKSFNYYEYTNPKYDTCGWKYIFLDEEYAGFAPRTFHDCKNIMDLFNMNHKFIDDKRFDALTKNLILKDTLNELTVKDLVNFEDAFNNYLQDYYNKLAQSYKGRYENLFGDNLKSVANGVRESKNKKVKILVNNDNQDEPSM